MRPQYQSSWRNRQRVDLPGRRSEIRLSPRWLIRHPLIATCCLIAKSLLSASFRNVSCSFAQVVTCSCDSPFANFSYIMDSFTVWAACNFDINSASCLDIASVFWEAIISSFLSSENLIDWIFPLNSFVSSSIALALVVLASFFPPCKYTQY